jgi:hypothetical protein
MVHAIVPTSGQSPHRKPVNSSRMAITTLGVRCILHLSMQTVPPILPHYIRQSHIAFATMATVYPTPAFAYRFDTIICTYPHRDQLVARIFHCVLHQRSAMAEYRCVYFCPSTVCRYSPPRKILKPLNTSIQKAWLTTTYAVYSICNIMCRLAHQNAKGGRICIQMSFIQGREE